MKKFLALLVLILAGCEQPPPPKDPPPPAPIRTNSSLNIRINEDGSSDFSMTMHSNARSDAEAMEKVVKHLQDKLDGKVEAEVVPPSK